MKHPLCPACGLRMDRHGKTAAGTERYRCPRCRKTTIIHRTDTRKRHLHDHFVSWLTGTDSKQKIATKLGCTRRALTEEFQQFFDENPEPPIPADLTVRILIVDGTYLEGRAPCALVAVTERDRIFWRFAPEERCGTWLVFLGPFPPPEVVVADGQKGMQRFMKHHWPQTAFQRCHFHLVMLVTHYLTRNPKDAAGRAILDLAHRLKYVKVPAEQDRWLLLQRLWKKRYARVFAERAASGGYAHRKLRSVRSVLRRAVPHLFTYLDYPGVPEHHEPCRRMGEHRDRGGHRQTPRTHSHEEENARVDYSLEFEATDERKTHTKVPLARFMRLPPSYLLRIC